MKKIKLISLCLLSIVFLTSQKCNSSKDPAVNEKTPQTGECPLERLDWMVVKTGYDSKTLSKLASDLKVAAQADAAKIKQVLDAGGSIEGNFSSSLEQLIQGKAEKSSVVSQEFYESYLKMRMTSCNMLKVIKDGIYEGDAESLKEARNIFNKIQMQFAEIESEEKKKL